jgi:hypothetical protein
MSVWLLGVRGAQGLGLGGGGSGRGFLVAQGWSKLTVYAPGRKRVGVKHLVIRGRGVASARLRGFGGVDGKAQVLRVDLFGLGFGVVGFGLGFVIFGVVLGRAGVAALDLRSRPAPSCPRGSAWSPRATRWWWGRAAATSPPNSPAGGGVGGGARGCLVRSPVAASAVFPRT